MGSLTCSFRAISHEVIPLLPSWIKDERMGYIEELFLESSDRNIRVRPNSNNIEKTLQGNVSDNVDDLDLHRAVNLHFNNKFVGQNGIVDEILVLFCSMYRRDDRCFGLMFDTNKGANSSGPPRQACAVFLDAINKHRQENDIYEQTWFTTIHEIGHIFNLGHSSDSNYMHQSEVDFAFPVGVDGYYKFDEEQKDKLKSAFQNGNINPDVWPGGSDYVGLDASDSIQIKSLRFFGLDIQIEMSRHSFYYFEPVELDIMIRVLPGTGREFEIPDRIDPKYSDFRIWIEEPNGERRIYHSSIRVCGQGKKLKITEGSPYLRDISIFKEANGYTFDHSGIYKLWVDFRIENTLLSSNKIDVEILSAMGGKGIDARNKLLTSENIKKLLFYRRDDSKSGNSIKRIEKYLKSNPNDPAHGALLYQLIRSQLRNVNIHNMEEDLVLSSKLREQLLCCIDHKFLGAQQRRIAMQLVHR